jgi:hypothetical protein
MVTVLRGRWGPPVAPPAAPSPAFVRLITGLSRTYGDRAGTFLRYRAAHTLSVVSCASWTVAERPTG